LHFGTIFGLWAGAASADPGREIHVLRLHVSIEPFIGNVAEVEGRSFALSVLRPAIELDRRRAVSSRQLYTAAKRLLDLVVAVPIFILALPLLAVLAVVVKCDSVGPVLFRQQRLGLNGNPFDIFKLRTMTVMENGETVAQARRGDARVTRVGRFLRASSLDELPQLINVIAGDMSLVGPRPHAKAHDRYYSCLIAGYNRRHAVKPGITGWAQVNGLRGETPTVASMAARIDLDVWYVHHANLALDLQILLRTPFEIFCARNAF
jgi:putative colanic acid biosysnthesis UDP-glucose lipid carrier transferase